MTNISALTEGPQHRAAILTRLAPTEDTAERTVEGLAVPYGDEYQELAPGLFERFSPDALVPDPNGVKLRLEHAETIGRVVEFHNDADGAHIVARISETTAGNDAYTLARDGALSSLSIGFIPDAEAMTVTSDEDGNVFVTHSSARLIEVSLVSFPAYAAANLTNVRHRQEKDTPTMDTAQIMEELGTLRSSLADVDRKATLAAENTAPAKPAPGAAYRSAGEYIKAVAKGEAAASRALTDNDATHEDTATKPAWVNRAIQIMEEKQRLTNLFTHTRALPDKGLSIEYPQLEDDTLVVAKQENEGDTLSYGKIVIGTGTAPVSTYGGYAKLSRQAVERSSANYLSTLFALQATHYAATIEAATVELVAATITQQTESSPITVTSAATAVTVNELITAVIDLAVHYDSTPYTLSGILASPDVFKNLATLDEAPKALQFTEAPNGRQGTITVAGPRGTVAGIMVDLLPTGEGILAGYDRSAIVIEESPGAPFRLSDQDITDLTNIYSVYGYAAHYAPLPGAIVPIKFGQAAA